MKFSQLRILIKIVSYLSFLAVVVFAYRMMPLVGMFLGSLFILFLGLDIHDYRLHRIFGSLFIDGNDKTDLESEDLDGLLVEYIDIHKRNTKVIHDIRRYGLTNLGIKSSMEDKDKFVQLFSMLESNLNKLIGFYSDHILFADFKSKKGKKAFFLAIGSFIDIYLVGSVVAKSSSFGVNLLERKFETTISDLSRTMLYPSLQIYLRLSFYILRKMKFDNPGTQIFKDEFVDNVLLVNKLEILPFSSSSTYWISLWSYFKRKEILPFEKNISEFAFKTKIKKSHTHKAMTENDMEEVMKLILPGDIVLTRRASYLSGALIPGYWTHASIYLGDYDDIEKMFESDTENVLKGIDYDFDKKVILESIIKGVSFTAAEEGLRSDAILVLRPNLGVYEKIRAVRFIFEHMSSSYNFSFDFTDEDSFVCSELVYKAYLNPKTNTQTLGFKIKRLFRSWTFSPQDIFKSFMNGNDKLELVICYLHDTEIETVRRVGLDDLKRI